MSLFEKINKFFNPPEVNLLQFNDDLALKISWEPLVKGGASFRTRKAVVVNNNRVEFMKTRMMKVFPWFFLCMPFLFFYFDDLGNIFHSNEFELNNSNLLMTCALVINIFAGHFLIKHFSKFIIFDKRQGFFWKNRKHPRDLSPVQRKGHVKLEDIHALQIILERVRSGSGSNSSSFTSYELNLVLKNGERVNVIDHGNRTKLIEDAQLISKFIDVPIWNVT